MNPAAVYQHRAIEGASPVGRIVLLYQAAVVQLRRAIAAMEAEPQTPRAIETRARALHHVLAIVGGLQGVLDFQRGGGVARTFDHFYALSQHLILEAVSQRNPQPLRELLPQFELVLNAWRQVEARPASASAGSAAWTA